MKKVHEVELYKYRLRVRYYHSSNRTYACAVYKEEIKKETLKFCWVRSYQQNMKTDMLQIVA